MSVWEIKDCLSHITVWNEADEDDILSLCKASLKEIEALLKADADHSDARIASAAAACAYYKLSLRRSYLQLTSEETVNFKAGDVSITQNKADFSKVIENAEKLYDEAMKNLIPLCSDNGFAFENVKVKVVL